VLAVRLSAIAVRCDVTRAEDVKAALDKTIEVFGHLDVAFNNAGSEQAITATADLTEEEWDRIVSINLRSVFLCMKYEIPLMLKQGSGAIVNTSRLYRSPMTDDSVGKGNKQRLIIYNQSAVSFSALTTKNFPLLKLSH
jgi:NAD(P)-dependent dehydrogenase (short-subunit alcohol dehydrogenase family)